MKKIIPLEDIESRICFIRGQKVMLDRDLAGLYGVETYNLNKATKRNLNRFPSDFMFKLTPEEVRILIFQIGISSSQWGGHRYAPYVFTQEGIAMLSSVLRSRQAVQVNIAIMRAFVRTRQVLSRNKGFAKRLQKLEQKVDLHDTDIRLLIQDVRRLLSQPVPDIPLTLIHKIKGFEKE